MESYNDQFMFATGVTNSINAEKTSMANFDTFVVEGTQVECAARQLKPELILKPRKHDPAMKELTKERKVSNERLSSENVDISHLIKRHRASEKTKDRGQFRAVIGNIEFTIVGKKATNPISVANITPPKRTVINSARKKRSSSKRSSRRSSRQSSKKVSHSYLINT